MDHWAGEAAKTSRNRITVTNLTEILMPLWEGAVFAFTALWAECTFSLQHELLPSGTERRRESFFRGTKSPSKGCCGSLCCAAPLHAGRHVEIPGEVAKMWWWKKRGRSQFP